MPRTSRHYEVERVANGYIVRGFYGTYIAKDEYELTEVFVATKAREAMVGTK
jgi:hypothetical protein